MNRAYVSKGIPMRGRRRKLGKAGELAFLLLTIVLSPSPSSAIKDERLDRMPENYRRWLEEEVVYIISDREKEAFLDLQSVEEWEAFIQAFWRRRDPDLLTPVNEFREEHYRRLDHANRVLGRESAVPGWMTDRGRMYIILGEPDDRDSFVAVSGLYPTEVWFYQADKARSLPPLYLLFFQDNNAGPYRLFDHLLDRPEDLMPAQPLDPDNSRRDAYEFLQRISPDLANATLTMRADESPYANLYQPDRSGLDFQMLLADIEQSPFRRVDTSYVDAAEHARGLVESDYLFNFVPNAAEADVLPGPGGTRFVHYSIEIEPQHMTLARDEADNVYYTRFQLRGEVTTISEQKPILQFVKEPYMTLTESQFRDVHERPFSYRDMFPIASGDFLFRVVLKNQARSEYTIFETELHVPESTEAPSIGPLVLLYGTDYSSDRATANVYRTYQLGALRINPNTRRAYVAGEALHVYVPVENATDAHAISLRLVNREDDSQPFEESKLPLGRYGGAPIVESLPLVGVTGGRYRLIADLMSPTGEVLATSLSDFDISPRTSMQLPWTLRESINGEETGLVLSALADQYMKLGDMAKGRELYQKALRDNPNLLIPRLVLARFRLDEKNPLEAIKLLEPAYAQSPKDTELVLTLADAHFEAKSYQRAAELYEAAVILRPPSTGLLNALGLSLARIGKTRDAIHYLERSLELDPDQASVKSILAKLKGPSPD